MRTVLLGVLAAVVLWGGAVSLDPVARAQGAEREELFYYPNGKFLKEAVLGYDQAAASINWLRTVQYYGEHAKTDFVFDQMYHMCDVVTDLDPRFEAPYVFGSFVLLTDGRRPEEGLELLRKGREQYPESWRIQFESGFVYYVCFKDYERASEFFRAAASMPGAPEYAARFAAYVSQKAGSLEAALVLWSEYAERAQNPELRRKAEEKIAEIRAMIEERDRGAGL